MKLLLFLLLAIKVSAFGIILPEIEWDLPVSWNVLKLDKAESPYVIVTREDLKILVLRLPDERSLTWSVVKSWTESLGLPFVTEVDLPAKFKLLGNGAKVINLKNEKQAILGGFLELHGNLWVFKFAASTQQVFFLSTQFERFLGSIVVGDALSKYVQGVEKKAISGNINSQLEFAGLLMQGKGVDRSLEKAVAFLNKAREAGAPEAAFELALIAQKEGRLSDCFTLLQEGATRKHIASLKKLSGLIIELKQDYESAVNYLKVAANLGDPEAMYFLGNIYFQERSLKDESAAVKWISQAADKGHSGSLHLLGVFYRNGYGVEKSLKKALELLTQAAAKNEIRSLEILGDIYYRGELGEKQPDKALGYYVKATMEGSTEALVKVAEMYIRGQGVEKNVGEGIKLLSEAARRGNGSAMNRLGELYTRGIEVKAAFEKAYEWYLKSAEIGDSAGMFGVSLALFAGKGVKKDPLEAVKWMKMAAAKGHATAKKMLKETGF
ncbi:MAG: sel1 repeat family protein [Lentisphaerales bacterium]|nr:sel1 repeat family protein [Lentisphaerales bacterium]